MKISRNKLLSAIAIILLVSFAASLSGALAHVPALTIATTTYANVAPNPIGVGQATTFTFWTSIAPPDAANNAAIRWNYTVSVTDPNQAVTNLGRFVSDVNGLGSVPFTPTIVGNYMLSVTFQATNYSFSATATQKLYTNDLFQTSSTTANFTVQSAPVNTGSVLPADYWSSNVQGSWYQINGNTYGGGANIPSQIGNHGCISINNDYGSVTGHIIWVRPIQAGGQVGGKDVGVTLGNGFYQGMAYNMRYTTQQPTILMNGLLYYKEPVGNSGSGGNYLVVDMRTGGLVQRSNVATLGMGYSSNNVTCIFSNTNLGTPRDPLTLAQLPWTLTGVPTATSTQTTVGSHEEFLRLVFANINTTATPGTWNLAEWNSSKAITPGISGTVDASQAKYFDFNVTIQENNANWAPATGTGTVVVWAYVANDYVLLTNMTGDRTIAGAGGDLNAFRANDTDVFWTVSLKPDNVGTVIADVSFVRNNSPLDQLLTPYITPGDGDLSLTSYAQTFDRVTHVQPLWSLRTMVWFGLNTLTGQIWGPTAAENQMDYYAAPDNCKYNRDSFSMNGYLWDASWGGVLYVYNVTTGQLLYTYGLAGQTLNANVTSAGLYTLYNGYPVATLGATPLNNMIYICVNEHSPNVPELKNSYMRAFNIATAQEIWMVSGYGGVWSTYTGQEILGNGYNTELNSHTMEITCEGLGPSATTVQTANSTLAGGKMIIEGTVLDVSAGTQQNDLNGRFPNGVACVQEGDNMTAWMEYLYMHHEPAPNVLGVDVTLTLIDASGTSTVIGNVKSDSTGYYSLVYTAPAAGTYAIDATFAGSTAYAPSSAQQAFTVAAQPPTATPSPTPSPAGVTTDTYVLGSTAAIIVVIAIVTAVIALMLRKKP